MNRRSFLTTAALGSVALVVGCKPKAPYALVPISGVATYNGKPLPTGFTVQLEPPDKGAKPGTNVVHIYWNDPPEVNPVPDEYKNLMAKYGFSGSEKMTVEVSKKDANFKIDFTD